MRGNLSQTEFAEAVGINRSLISSYESGRKSPSMASLEKLADYDRVTVDYLLNKKNVPSHKLNSQEGNMIYRWRKLPPESRALFDNLLEKLSDEPSLKQNKKARKTRLY